MSSIKEIKNIEKIRKSLIQEIINTKEMIPGAFKQVHRKCGKENCWCYSYKGNGHPLNRIIWTENGKVKTRAIPGEDVDWIKNLNETYNQFKSKCKEVQKLESDLKKWLDIFRKDVIKNTRKLRKYL